MAKYLPSWNSVTRAVTAVYDFTKDINPATLSGAIDVIVVQDADGSLACSPFHVRFGKLKLLMPSEKAVSVHLCDELM
jgi:phosphatidate phosphatase LPIN